MMALVAVSSALGVIALLGAFSVRYENQKKRSTTKSPKQRSTAQA